MKQRNNASFFLIAAIKQHKRFISICLAGESPSASVSGETQRHWSWWWSVGSVRNGKRSGGSGEYPVLATQTATPAVHIRRFAEKGSRRRRRKKHRLHASSFFFSRFLRSLSPSTSSTSLPLQFLPVLCFVISFTPSFCCLCCCCSCGFYFSSEAAFLSPVSFAYFKHERPTTPQAKQQQQQQQQ